MHIAYCLAYSGSPALPSDTIDRLDSFTRALPGWWHFTWICAFIALASATSFYRWIMAQSEGNERMQEIARYVREGSYAYLRRQYRVVAIFFVVVSALLAVMAFGLHVQHKLVPFAFLTGGFFSGLAGFFGMKTATSASARTAQGASQSLDQGLKIAFRAGAVMGLTVVGLAMLDISLWFLYLYKFHHQVFGGEPMSLETITVVMLCFGMGASSQALFARVGGGIYTKAADVGADLVGKVEAGIPEDDPRNPATIADNVGDNVGDVAGMGADLYESYAGSILATMALGVAAVTFGGVPEGFETALSAQLAFMGAPMVLSSLGILLSLAGIFLVTTKEGASMKDLMWALNKGIWGSSAMVVVVAAVVMPILLPASIAWGVVAAVTIGLIVGLIIGYGTEYYTSAEYKPTKGIADQATSGTGPLIIDGIAAGLMSTWIPITAVCLGMLLSFGMCHGFENLAMGLYGVGMASVGMLSTLGITLATDAYGPIADNAGGNAEMAGLSKQVRERTDALDSLGNTTAAVGKGFAIGSAALTSLALLAAYIEEVRVGIHREAAAVYQVEDSQGYNAVDLGFGKYGLYVPGADGSHRENYTISAFESTANHAVEVVVDGNPVDMIINHQGASVLEADVDPVVAELTAAAPAGLFDFMDYYEVTLMNPKVLVGIFSGVLMVFVFGAMTMKAVGRAAMEMVREVRRQFREMPGIMEGTTTPDYARCVAISTAGAQREMIRPSLLAVLAPVLVGLLLGVSGVMGLLVGGLCAGFALAVFMANAGGAWDNAKKLIETGQHGGKGSDAHKSAVVGDTVGDPFKDTTGPSLNILIKLMNMVSIVFAGLVVKYAPEISSFLGMGQ
ncbi:sodium-translocating pyrophosphatase [Bythopirellula goksoeyrii]|uniref:Putative K(+)-stimulated pyrophosphate-energized sodium pump n=1 Tax=Bythopirellula goksoeyrii TaxID=1400387 RepID=A0A5B9Q7Z5_9BACT|nr:sodium-translocating pyrophosphatase [Bythopirellula goksoeyrii]QEG33779.1 Putative K(+)-stimulated pyrophosphate-energized sodium pump [Bythopirellula goksoeyrii]